MDTLKPVARKRAVAKSKDAHVRRVIETAKRMIAKGGIEKLTIRRLAKASGVAPATLYNRFVDKETLISIVVVDHYEREVREGFVSGGAPADEPLERLRSGLKSLARTCHDHPAFIRAVVGMYYSLAGRRDMPNTMYRSLHDTLSALLAQMQEKKLLQDWASADAACAEICERCFSCIHQLIIGELPDRNFVDHLTFGAFSILLGVSRDPQRRQIQETLEELLSKPGFAVRAGRKSRRDLRSLRPDRPGAAKV